MEAETNHLTKGSQEAQDEVPNLSSEPLRETFENVDVEDDFFEIQTLVNNEMIRLVELKDMELSKEKQELTNKLAERVEVMKNLVNISKGPQKVKMHKKKDESLISTNVLYYCPECTINTKKKHNLKVHINAVHRKLKPFNCSECNKGKRIKIYHLKYLINILF